jgi:hypothetical protein
MRQFRVGEHERDLERLLDGLLGVEADDVVVDRGVVGELAAGIARRCNISAYSICSGLGDNAPLA